MAHESAASLLYRFTLPQIFEIIGRVADQNGVQDQEGCMEPESSQHSAPSNDEIFPTSHTDNFFIIIELL